MAFPLTFTWPPLLSPHKNAKDNSWSGSSGAIIYAEPTKLDAPRYMKTSAALYEKTNPKWKKKPKGVMYYSKRDKGVSKQKKEDSIEVTLSVKETQIWGSSKDWLWLEMERTNSEGHVTMRCKRMAKK